jgi:ribonuclease P protein component
LRALRLKTKLTNPDVLEETAPSAENTQQQPTRIGISISTKVSKKAVVRNRIKRQLRAAFGSLLPRISPGWLIVVVVQPSAGQQECVTQQFLQELEQLLVAAEVLNGNS